MTVVPIACQSEGALEIYIEPVVPVPHLVIVGSSPMARTLAGLAGALGWRTDLIPGPDFTPDSADERSMIVVATQGHDDEDVLERAAKARPAYLGLVGSRRRGAAVLGYLADREASRRNSSIGSGCPPGSTSARRRTRRSPSPSWRNWSSCAHPARMAVRRAAAPRLPQAQAVAQRSEEAQDPVCGMTVTVTSGQPLASA